MKLYIRSILITSISALGFTLLGCSDDEAAAKAITIAPGHFVLDEPGKIHGELKESDKCSVDTVNEKLMNKERFWKIIHGDDVTIKGWAFTRSSSEEISEIYVRLTGSTQTYYAVTMVRSDRPDVNHVHGLDQTVKVGFELKANTGQMEPGAYEIEVIQPLTVGVEGCTSPAMLLVD